MKYPIENEIKAAKIRENPKNNKKRLYLRLKERVMWLYNRIKSKGDFENHS